MQESGHGHLTVVQGPPGGGAGPEGLNSGCISKVTPAGLRMDWMCEMCVKEKSKKKRHFGQCDCQCFTLKWGAWKQWLCGVQRRWLEMNSVCNPWDHRQRSSFSAGLRKKPAMVAGFIVSEFKLQVHGETLQDWKTCPQNINVC